MSLANNELSRLPGDTLALVNVSLQYLSLANNNFYYLFYDDEDETFRRLKKKGLLKKNFFGTLQASEEKICL